MSSKWRSSRYRSRTFGQGRIVEESGSAKREDLRPIETSLLHRIRPGLFHAPPDVIPRITTRYMSNDKPNMHHASYRCLFVRHWPTQSSSRYGQLQHPHRRYSLARQTDPLRGPDARTAQILSRGSQVSPPRRLKASTIMRTFFLLQSMLKFHVRRSTILCPHRYRRKSSKILI